VLLDGLTPDELVKTLIIEISGYTAETDYTLTSEWINQTNTELDQTTSWIKLKIQFLASIENAKLTLKIPNKEIITAKSG
jgi:hypothetical protein